MTPDEAAERHADTCDVYRVRDCSCGFDPMTPYADGLRATERKATVERIRRELRWIDMELKSGRVVRVYPQDVVFAILAAELSASPETDSQAER